MKLATPFRLKKRLNVLGFVTCAVVVVVYIVFSFHLDYSQPSSPLTSIKIFSENVSFLENSPIFLPNTTIKSLNASLSMLEQPTKERLDYLLNVRKLNVFAVHEMNRLIQMERNHRHLCSKWWSNPLNTISVEQVDNTSIHTDYLIAFQAEPGRVLFQVLIRQFNPPLEVWKVPELQIIGSYIHLQKSGLIQTIKNYLGTESCKGIYLPKSIATICSCVESEALFTNQTDEERKIWNATDIELFSWKPDQSFYIGDYFNITDYSSFILSPGKNLTVAPETVFCGPNLKMLIMISSAPTHYEHRKIIRKTYGSDQNLHPKGVRLVFLLGKVESKSVQTHLEKEAETHDDIIQADFMDSYHNLTLSHLSMYKWAYLTCTKGPLPLYTVPKSILKADDDFFINIDLALRVAEENPDIEMMGCLFCGTKPIRNIAYMTKYYTPRYMHSAEWYSGYLSGVAYILRGDVILRLLYASINTPIIHMDDAYVTGMLPRQVNFYPHGSPLITYGRSNLDPCSMKKMVSSYVLSREDMQAQWDQWSLPVPENCTLSDLKLKVPPLRPQDKTYCYF